MTPGYLLDLLIINEVRKEKLADDLDGDLTSAIYVSGSVDTTAVGTYELPLWLSR